MPARFFTILLFAIAIVPSHAFAECIDDIRAMYEEVGDIGGVSYKSVTEIGGAAVQEHRGWHQDYRHNMSELVGRNAWFMVYGDTSWESSDGKTWKKAEFQDPDWEKTSRAQRADLLANMTDTECPGTEEVEGRTVEVYRYVHKTETPWPSHFHYTIHYDRKNNFIYRTIHKDLSGSDTVLIHTYTQDPTIVIPDPES